MGGSLSPDFEEWRVDSVRIGTVLDLVNDASGSVRLDSGQEGYLARALVRAAGVRRIRRLIYSGQSHHSRAEGRYRRGGSNKRDGPRGVLPPFRGSTILAGKEQRRRTLPLLRLRPRAR